MRETIFRNNVFKVLLVATLVLMAVTAGMSATGRSTSGAIAPATAPAVQITPNRGHIHDNVVLTGQGFAANEPVSFQWGTHPFFAARTDASGNFLSAPHPVQWYAAYPGVIKATGSISGRTATTTFTVVP